MLSKKLIALLYIIIFSLINAKETNQIDFLEKFNLSDKKKALTSLAPGTENYYYYNSLFLEHQNKFDEQKKLITEWKKIFPFSQKRNEIINRRNLSLIDKNVNYFKKKLGLNFNHSPIKKNKQRSASYPNSISPNKITTDAFFQKFLKFNNYKNFNHNGIRYLCKNYEKLNELQLKNLVNSIQTPLLPNLTEITLKYLKNNNPEKINIYKILTLKQLDELRKKIPKLLQSKKFTSEYINKLHPNIPKWTLYTDEKIKYLNKLNEFIKSLPNTFVNLKAQTLFHILKINQKKNTYKLNTLIDYLKIPKNHTINDEIYLQFNSKNQYKKASISQKHPALNSLPPITPHNEKILITQYIEKLIQKNDDYEKLYEFLNKTFLDKLITRTKLIFGKNTNTANLTPEQLKNINQKVEIIFDQENKNIFTQNEEVSLKVNLKNTPELIIKIYEINTINYNSQNQKDIDINFNLEGIQASKEIKHKFKEKKILRHSKSFSFPSLNNKNGIWIIDFIANGKNTRAIIKKGQIKFKQKITPKGQLFTIYDANDNIINDAKLQINNQIFKTIQKNEENEKNSGKILIPFTANTKTKNFNIIHKNFSQKHSFTHHSQNHKIKIKAFIPYESTATANNSSQILIEPQLTITEENIPISLKNLTNASLKITTTDINNNKSTQNYTLDTTKNSFAIPLIIKNKILNISATINAKILDQNNNEKNLNATWNSLINYTNQNKNSIANAYLNKNQNDTYSLKILGQNGEAQSQKILNVTFTHKFFNQTISEYVSTNDNGTINLPKLKNITEISINLNNSYQKFIIFNNHVNINKNITANTSDSIKIPLLNENIIQKTRKNIFNAIKPNKENNYTNHFSLVEYRKNSAHADHSNKITLKNNYIYIENLSIGKYKLFTHHNSQHYNINITDDKKINLNEKQINISNVSTNSKHLKIKLSEYSQNTNIHIFASNFYPKPYSNAYAHLYKSYPNIQKNHTTQTPPISIYTSERTLSDEYKYILNRQNLQTYNGIMAKNPSLILNNRTIKKSYSKKEILKKGTKFKKNISEIQAQNRTINTRKNLEQIEEYEMQDNNIQESTPVFSTLHSKRKRNYNPQQSLSTAQKITLPIHQFNQIPYAFLQKPAISILKQKPDPDGFIIIPIEIIKNYNYLQIIATDTKSTLNKNISLDYYLNKKNVTLTNSFTSEKNIAQKNEISILLENQQIKIDKQNSKNFAIYDNIQKVWNLLQAISPDKYSKDFTFILNWNTFDQKTKLKLYSQYACTELNFYLYKKDQEFFKQNIKKFIANKLQKTFFDHYLLEQNLSKYLKLNQFNKLNIVEKILLAHKTNNQKIIQYINNLNEKQPQKPELNSQLFDTALNANNISQNQIHQENVKRPQKITKKTKNLIIASPNQTTKLVAEQNYYNLKNNQQNANLIKINPFWAEIAKNPNSIPKNITHINQNFSEKMLALAFIPLSNDNTQNFKITQNLQNITIKATKPIIIYHKKFQNFKKINNSNIIVNQKFYDPNNFQKIVKGKTINNYINSNFLFNKIYNCQITVTNTSSANEHIKLFYQIPLHAINLTKSYTAHTKALEIPPFSIKKINYSFYFPKLKENTTIKPYPPQIFKENHIIASAKAQKFTITTENNSEIQNSWDFIAQNGNEKDIIKYLNDNNPLTINLDLIAWKLKDKSFFNKITDTLTDKFIYHHTTWSYALYHLDLKKFATFIKQNQSLNSLNFGLYFKNDWINLNPNYTKKYQHIELEPFIKARQHSNNNSILNQDLENQYSKLLKLLAQKNKISPKDKLQIIYYLIIQKKYNKAINIFDSIKKNELKTKLQLDYIHAYISILKNEIDLAQNITQKYLNYPITKWQKKFTFIHNTIIAKNNNQKLNSKKNKSFEFNIIQNNIILTSKNIKNFNINYYKINLEYLFSTQPFAELNNINNIEFIKAKFSKNIQLENQNANSITKIPLNEQFKDSNTIIQITTPDYYKNITKAHYINNISTNINNENGIISAFNKKENTPIRKAYIKVYAKYQNNTVKFHKDGYSNIIGEFNYFNTNQTQKKSPNIIKKFAILITHPEHGTSIKIITPPIH